MSDNRQNQTRIAQVTVDALMDAFITGNLCVIRLVEKKTGTMAMFISISQDLNATEVSIIPVARLMLEESERARYHNVTESALIFEKQETGKNPDNEFLKTMGILSEE